MYLYDHVAHEQLTAALTEPPLAPRALSDTPPCSWLSRAATLPSVRLADPARLLLTDFHQESPCTVSEHRTIDEALGDMVRLGVRALLVIRDERLSGLITSYDIQGERPLQFLQQSTFLCHEEIEVGHIMTPWSELRVLAWQTVEHARVWSLVKAFEHSEVTHLLVIETAQDRSEHVRGLISRSRLVRQLGKSS